METAVAATEINDLDWMSRMIIDMKQNSRSEQDDIDIIDTRIKGDMENTDKIYDKNGANERSEEEIQQAVLDRTVPTLIANAGLSASCGQPLISDCRRYTLDNDPFIATGQKSDKIFSVALGNIAPADKIKRLPFKIRHPGSKVHMVPGIKHNLLLMNQFVEAKYITIFDDDQVNIYEATNTEVTVLQGSVLRSWMLRDEGLWRIP